MALKSDFQDASFISSPFVDEIANPGSSVLLSVGRNVSRVVNETLSKLSAARKRGSERNRETLREADRDRARIRKQGF